MFGMFQKTLRTFYIAITESFLTSCISVRYGNSTAADHKHLQGVVKTAERIVWALLSSLQDIYHRVRRSLQRYKGPSPVPAHALCILLSSSMRHSRVRYRTSRLKDSFNSQSTAPAPLRHTLTHTLTHAKPCGHMVQGLNPQVASNFF